MGGRRPILSAFSPAVGNGQTGRDVAHHRDPQANAPAKSDNIGGLHTLQGAAGGKAAPAKEGVFGHHRIGAGIAPAMARPWIRRSAARRIGQDADLFMDREHARDQHVLAAWASRLAMRQPNTMAGPMVVPGPG